jgi:pyruvate/2-oxoglutarate/acetoin dehydrogenase E1 component
MSESTHTMVSDCGFPFRRLTMKTYAEHLCEAMKNLAKCERVRFLGQSVVYSGNSIYKTLVEIPAEKKIETPVFEELQMGMSLGMAMNGLIPVTCYPRWDFLICATSQLVNHVDKLGTMTNGKFSGGVIIRTAVGASKPIDSGVQHTQNHTAAFEHMLTTVRIFQLDDKAQIIPAYKEALLRAKQGLPTLLVEYGEHYSS